jgi:fluoroquinolone transport system permease protein
MGAKRKKEMMWSRFKSSFIADINIITHDKKLLARGLAPFILIILLKFVFPPLSVFIFSRTGFPLDKYYSLIAITFVSIIPILPGIVYAFILLGEKDLHIQHIIEVTQTGRRKFLMLRMMIPAFISFVLIMITILLAKPVPTEGWLRTLFAAFLLSIQSTFVFLFISTLAENKINGLALSRLYWIFLITVPLGLMLHHPWNYFAFFSPLYWVAWTWIVPSPVESLIYGSIAVILTSGSIIIFFRHLVRKHTS